MLVARSSHPVQANHLPVWAEPARNPGCQGPARLHQKKKKKRRRRCGFQSAKLALTCPEFYPCRAIAVSHRSASRQGLTTRRVHLPRSAAAIKLLPKGAQSGAPAGSAVAAKDASFARGHDSSV